jgi:Subtilase family
MEPTPAPRELVVVAEPQVGLRAHATEITSLSGVPLESLSAFMAAENLRLEPLFGLSEEAVDRRFVSRAFDAGEPWSAASLFYKVSAPDLELESLAAKFREFELVHAAFIKPGVELPFMPSGQVLKPDPLPPVTRDFSDMQLYLGPAPHGVDAFAAWTCPGGTGDGIRIIDIEGAWRFSHEDLKQNQGGVVGGTQTPEQFWRSHGTAVLGIISGDRQAEQNLGIIGICPDANVRAVSVFGQPASQTLFDSGTAAAIRQAADLLRPGDIMVLEMHSPGPPNFEVRQDQRGYIPIEWWPDNFKAIQDATRRGIIVVEAAGNGNRSLDEDIFEHQPAPQYGPFPNDWKNPFRRTNVDSGAILVGAGAPPRVLNDVDHGRGLSRMAESNFGSIVDAQGWGQDVTTSGFGNLQEGLDEDRWYTRDFGGTSAATPMVAAALACVQGALLKAGWPVLTPLEARQLLEETSTPQVDGDPGSGRPASQRIGGRPNLKAMLEKKRLLNSQLSVRHAR